MMKNLYVFSATLFLGLFSSISFGALSEFNVYFLNGINSSPKEAKESRDKLRSLVLPDVPDGNVHTLYQNNDRALGEMIDAVRQQASSDNQRHLYKSYWKCLYDSSPDSCDVATPPKESMRRLINRVLAKFDEAAYVQNPQLQAMVSTITDNYYNKRKKTLLVSHSQGNFYANQLVNYLQSFDPAVAACVEVVGVATPATYVVKSGPYETRADDVVVNAARANFFWGGSILPATWTPPFPAPAYPDPSHHAFVASYLGPGALRQRIRDSIALQTASAADSSCAICAPFNQTLVGARYDEYYRFFRYVGPGRRTINVRVDFDRPNISGFTYDYSLYITPKNDDQNHLLHTWEDADGTYRYSFVFDSAQLGTNEIWIHVYVDLGSSVKICVDCGNETASSPTACP